MGYSNGQVQTQSEGGKGEKGDPGLPGIGFNLNDDGNFDLDSKRLTDVAEPKVGSDAATKNYVDTKNTAINSKAEKTDVILRDGSQSMKGSLDMENDKVKHQIINLANGTDDNDAVNLAQLKSFTDSHQNNYHLRQNFTFYKDYGNFIKLNFVSYNSTIGHRHRDGCVIVKESDNGHSNSIKYAWSSIRATNT